MLKLRKFARVAVWSDQPSMGRTSIPGKDFWYWPEGQVGLVILSGNFYSSLLIDGKQGWVANDDLKDVEEETCLK